MKTIIFICILSLFIIAVYAQEKIVTVRLHRSSNEPAAIVELPYLPYIIEADLKDYISKKGNTKGTDLKGFMMFRNTQLIVTGNDIKALFKI